MACLNEEIRSILMVLDLVLGIVEIDIKKTVQEIDAKQIQELVLLSIPLVLVYNQQITIFLYISVDHYNKDKFVFIQTNMFFQE